MKQHHVFSFLQRMGKSFMLPIAVLPVAGIFLGVGSSLTNETTIAALHLESVLGQGTFLYSVLILLKQVGKILFDNLPLIFAVSIALGMSKRRKEVAALAAIIAFFVMHATINALLCLDGSIVNGVVSGQALDGSITWVCGMLSLEMGVFGGIIVGLGVSYLHNRFYQIQLPNVISFYEGERFVPIVCAVTYVFVGVLMYFVWPPLQHGVYNLGRLISDSGYFGTFIYGVIKRSLVPFGLHHVWYMPFYQSALGGVQMVNGSIISGAQNIFFAQLSDPSVTHFSVNATKFFSGEFIFMIFGLPGAALAMYQCANPEAKKKTASLLLSAALTSALTGITEPIEFSFLFVAPLLYVVHVFLAATCFVIAQALQVAIGFTFSAGLLDFTLFGILQGNAKTNWITVVLLGLVYFFVYYGVFKFLIVKCDLKTPGRDESIKVFDKKKYDSVDYETFNAAQAVVTFDGTSIHPGDAKDRMVNASLLAMEYASSLPKKQTPSHTQGRQGFYHLVGMEGICEDAKLTYILRNHSKQSFIAQKQKMEAIADKMNEKYGNRVHVTIRDQYENMRQYMHGDMRSVNKAKYALRQCDVTPVSTPIRGGTDGAMLTARGLICPNLGTGSFNHHGRFEFASIQKMEKMVEIVLKIVE